MCVRACRVGYGCIYAIHALIAIQFTFSGKLTHRIQIIQNLYIHIRNNQTKHTRQNKTISFMFRLFFRCFSFLPGFPPACSLLLPYVPFYISVGIAWRWCYDYCCYCYWTSVGLGEFLLFIFFLLSFVHFHEFDCFYTSVRWLFVWYMSLRDECACICRCVSYMHFAYFTVCKVPYTVTICSKHV